MAENNESSLLKKAARKTALVRPIRRSVDCRQCTRASGADKLAEEGSESPSARRSGPGRRRMGGVPDPGSIPHDFRRTAIRNKAVQAHLDLQATATIGMHFGTFQMTTEGIDEPLHALNRAREALGVSTACSVAIRFGESVFLR